MVNASSPILITGLSVSTDRPSMTYGSQNGQQWQVFAREQVRIQLSPLFFLLS
jgi:hypothetical protein